MDGDLLRALSTDLDQDDRSRVYALLQRNLLGRDLPVPEGTASFTPARRAVPAAGAYRRSTMDPVQG